MFEASLVDCAGKLTLGDDPRLFPEEAERWVIDRINTSPARHYALVPSHPIGWTAGKWREWYPDVVAQPGPGSVGSNDPMPGTQGVLTADAEKYLWQEGWWDQHQRLLDALSNRPGSRITFSGDIHAQGAINVKQSGELRFEHEVQSVLVGPVSTSDATWPSAARGIPADQPAWLQAEEISATREVNGFSIFEFTPTEARVILFDCGGFDRTRGEDGRVQGRKEISIQGRT